MNQTTMKAIKPSSFFLLILLSISFLAQSQGELSPLEPEVKFEKLKLPNGETYIGQTEFHQPSGIGSKIDASGKVKTGYFQENKYLGDFIMTPPWHIVDVEFYLDTDYVFNSYSVDLNILTPIPNDTYLYIAPFGSGYINDILYYGGIQTHTGGYKNPNHNNEKTAFTEIGRAMIFSRWDERSPEAIFMDSSGVCESSGYEGDFVSVRNALNWTTGKYTFKIEKLNNYTNINSVKHSIVQMTVYEHKTKKTFNCGALAFPGDQLILSSSQFLFFELYGKRINVNQMPYAKFECSNFQIDGKPVAISSAGALYPKDFPKYGAATYSNGKFTIEIGKPSFTELGENEESYFEVLKSN
jgi:hypothetical protein